MLEKEQLTPEAYPLTLNLLLAACNQRSSREPVMTLSEGELRAALDRLHEHALVWRSAGARVERWEHSLDRRWELDGASKAVMTVLLLRGPQTPGEIRARSERLHAFNTPADVEAVLERLAAGDLPLVAELPRQPGHKEPRWTHLVGDHQQGGRAAEFSRSPVPSDLESRLLELERRVAELERRWAARE